MSSHFSRRSIPRRPTTSRESVNVPRLAHANATTSIGGLNARKDVGISAMPPTTAGMRWPLATRSAMPVTSATVATEMMFSGLGRRVRKNPFITPNVPATITARSERTTAPAANATPTATAP